MNIRPALITGGSLALGVLALGAVQSGLTLTMTAGRGTPSAGWAPMPDPAGGGVTSPPFPANLTAEERAHLETFDTLDFEVFTTHDWARLAESHAPNIRVHFPDGHCTDGLDKHIADMAAWAEWAPDIAIRVHPLRLAKDNLTAVSIAARRMWYDSVGHGHVPALRCAIDSLGASRLLLGTDFPYEAGDIFVRAVNYITDPRITEHEANAILEGNATALFGITTPANSPTA